MYEYEYRIECIVFRVASLMLQNIWLLNRQSNGEYKQNLVYNRTKTYRSITTLIN